MFFCDCSSEETTNQVLLLQHKADLLDVQLQTLKMEIAYLKGAKKETPINQLNGRDWFPKLKPKDAILHILSQYDFPISQKILKRLIVGEGYPLARFGKNSGYFYVLLDRLKDEGKLEREGDEVRLLPCKV